MASPKDSYPFYIQRYYGKTRGLSLIEHGVYRLLIDAYWENGGPLPGDEDRLRRIVGASPDEWAGARDNVLKFFKKTDKGWTHDTIDEIMDRELRIYRRRVKSAENARLVKTSVRTKADTKAETKADTKAETSSTLTLVLDKSTNTKVRGRARAREAPPAGSQQRSDAGAAAASPSDLEEDWEKETWKAAQSSEVASGSRKPLKTTRPTDEKLIALYDALGPNKWASWFEGGFSLKGGKYILRGPPAKMQMIEQRFAPDLNECLGKGEWSLQTVA